MHTYQALFTALLSRLIEQAIKLGYVPVCGEVARDKATALANAAKGIGTANSLHIDRLAVDLLLFKDGKYLTDSADYQPLGEWWEKQNPLCRWGGRFKDSKGRPKPDGNHFSVTPDGKRA